MDGRPNRSRGAHASAELREQAVRMVFEMIAETGEQVGAIARVSRSIGVNRETLRKWVRQTEVDAGRGAGLTTPERARLIALVGDDRVLDRDLVGSELVGDRQELRLGRPQHADPGYRPRLLSKEAGGLGDGLRVSDPQAGAIESSVNSRFLDWRDDIFRPRLHRHLRRRLGHLRRWRL